MSFLAAARAAAAARVRAGARVHRRACEGTRASRGATVRVLVGMLALAAAPLATAQQIYSCPQPGAPPRYQDRPCAATPPEAAPAKRVDGVALPATPASAPVERRSGRDAATRAANRAPVTRADAGSTSASAAPTAAAVASPELAPLDRAETRGEYVARNAQRCDAGDRRACVAVTCERRGGLGTKECQAALGYRRGPGWDLRPASDVFDPARRDDEYSLRCTQQPQRARVIVPRGGGEARVLAGGGEPTTLPLEGVADYATRYCRAR